MAIDPISLLILIAFMIISWVVSARLKGVFSKYSKVRISTGITGKEVADKMLKDNGIYDVKIQSVEGQLSDHYNPANKTINLSREVYYGNSVASAAVAAHETGHAVQHATAYTWLGLRSALVPVVNFSSRALSFIYLGMLFLAFSANMFQSMLLLIIIFQGALTLFSLITLPVEIDASKRAVDWLDGARITSRGQEHSGAITALRWAGTTYVVAALGSLTMLAYYIMRFLGNRD